MIAAILSLSIQIAINPKLAQEGNELATILVDAPEQEPFLLHLGAALTRSTVVNSSLKTYLARAGALVLPMQNRGFLVIDATSRGAYLLNTKAQAVSYWQFDLPQPEAGGFWPVDAALIRDKIVLSHNYGLVAKNHSTVSRDQSFTVDAIIGAGGKVRNVRANDEFAHDATIGWRMRIAGNWRDRIWTYGNNYVSAVSDRRLAPVFTLRFEAVVLAVFSDSGGGCSVLLADASSMRQTKLECIRLNRDGKVINRLGVRQTIGTIERVLPIQGSSKPEFLLDCEGASFVLVCSNRKVSVRRVAITGEVLDCRDGKVLYYERREDSVTFRVMELGSKMGIRSWSIPASGTDVIRAGLLE